MGLASTPDRWTEPGYGFSKRLADGGAGYADVIVNPTHWTAWHGRLPDMIDAIDAGFTAEEHDAGVYAAIADHPIDRLRRTGVAVSVKTDDPVLLWASLVGEYALCSKAFGWSDDDLGALARNSIDASFADAGLKARLIHELSRWRRPLATRQQFVHRSYLSPALD